MDVRPVSQHSERGWDQYLLDPVVRALYDKQKLDLNEERAKLAKIQTEKQQIEINKLNGELVPIGEVRKEASKVATSIKSKLTSMPARMAGQLSTMSDDAEIESALEEEIQQILEDLSNEDNDS